MMLTGDNSILNQATNAKESTIKGSEKEALTIAYNGVLTNNLGSVTEGDDFAQKLKEELEKNGYDVDVRDNGKTVEFNDTKNVYKLDIAKGTITKKEQQDRTGIEVGDYVDYNPDKGITYSTFLTTDYTGMSWDQSITQEYKVWRVLNKNNDGTLDLIPAFSDSSLLVYNTFYKYKEINFKSEIGYNNSIYILNDACKTLYEKNNKDIDKSIVARSLNYEDITKLLVQNQEGSGIKKIENYITKRVDKLTKGSDNVIEKNGNKITYKINTWYPKLHPLLINESDSFYKNSIEFEETAIANGKIEMAPDSLEVEDTYYDGILQPTDFADYKNETEKSKQQDVLFGFEKTTVYWIASRSVYCDKDVAAFFIRQFNSLSYRGVRW